VSTAEIPAPIDRKARSSDGEPAKGPAPEAWFAAMRAGDFESAWKISDQVLRQRLATKHKWWQAPRHLQPVWSGAPLAGKRVLVRCYHGLGDTIQFLRFANPLRDLAREVIVWAQPPLAPLIETAPGIDRVLPLHDGAPDAAYDLDIEIMELPHALRTTLCSLPKQVPYVRAPPPRNDPIPPGEGLRVGLVWESGDWDPRRSVPIAALSRLSSVPGIRLFSLQRGPARAQAGSLGALDISAADVSATATAMCCLDLIVSVDTMAAHLAGALGLPVWTLLHSDCDWRWMDQIENTPWYPTMRLFRQPRQGDWTPVIERVAAELRTHLG
jgi:hypothetical protein